MPVFVGMLTGMGGYKQSPSPMEPLVRRNVARET